MKLTPDKPGNQFNPFSQNNPMVVPTGVPIVSQGLKPQKTSSTFDPQEEKEVKYDKKKKKEKEFTSEEFLQCSDSDDFVDNREEVTKSCEDLAIDN